jgi:formylglycine-generating enzyme required for sulfatase activity
MPAPRLMKRHLAAVPAPLLLALLLTGCGVQDLYEPPGSPYQILSRLPLPSENEGVALLGHYAYVAGGQAGLHVVDIADPRHPVLVTTVNTQKSADSIEVIRTFAGHHLVDVALIVEGTEGITTYDITQPAQVVSFNQGSTAVDGKGLYVQEPADPDAPYLVFLAESWKGLRIFESDPLVPGLLRYNGVFAGTLGYAEGVSVKDGYAYTADDQMGLVVLDVRTLVYGLVQVVSWCDTPGNALDVAIVGDHAYVADATAGISIFAINGPEPPVRVGALDLSGYAKSIAVRDDLACLAAAGAGVHFVDVSRPDRPQYLGTVVTSYANDLALTEDGNVIVCDRDDGLVILGGRGPFTDRQGPAKVTSLAAFPYSTDGVRLSWYASGDDNFLGRAASCEIRRAPDPITDETVWEASTPVPNPPPPAEPGQEQSFIAGGLEPGTEYYFALKIYDEAGHASPLSTTATARTYEGIVLADPRAEPAYGTQETSFTYEVRYLFGGTPTRHDVVIDGASYAMQAVQLSKQDGALYRYQTTLSRGAHTYAFAFAAGEDVTAETPLATGPLVGAVVFTMGSPDTEPGRDADEILHAVVLNDSVLAQPHEVTQDEWTALRLVNPSRFVGGSLPVESVTWLDAIGYCNLRSAADGLKPAYDMAGDAVTWNRDANGWRLPTEAEWEWLCRAGSASAFAGGAISETACGADPVLNQFGWYCGNAANMTHDVALKSANDLGLYDMHGNVWEWCWDWYGQLGQEPVLDPAGPPDGFQRVIRGGSWYYYARDCRSASRAGYWPTSADDIVGFRIVRSLFGR